MKRYKVSDIFEGNGKNVNYYKTKQGSLLKVEKRYHKVGTGYIDYTVYRFSTKTEQWSKWATYNQFQLVENCKDWEHITAAEMFIEIL